MRYIFELLKSKIFNDQKIKNFVKKFNLLNSFYYGIKTEIAKKFLINNPTYSNIIHNQIIATSWDPVKYATMALAINKIRNQNIKGNFAELGVFRGESSRIIRLLAPEKKFYLFDTFEGFPLEFLENKSSDNRFDNTTLQIVKEKFGDLSNIIIKKGTFPETSKGLESELFSFVNIDVDLYTSTLKGLKFFYPRVVVGGYIFIHDYNNPKESNSGVYRAVNEFMKDKTEKIIEIPDVLGSAVIRKL